MGFGIAVALALDATLVRLLLIPAAMGLLGERNWYLPALALVAARTSRSKERGPRRCNRRRWSGSTPATARWPRHHRPRPTFS